MSCRSHLLSAAVVACVVASPAAAQDMQPPTATPVVQVADQRGPLADAAQLTAGAARRELSPAEVQARAETMRRELRAATMQRRSGQALVVAGGIGLGAAYAGYVGSGAMGMNGGQAALFAGATAMAATGITRWIAGRHRAERAYALASASTR